MFGFQLENDEWLLLIGLVCLASRLLYGFARVVWCFVTDTPYFPQSMSGFYKYSRFLFMPNLTFLACAAMSIALVSLLGGPERNVRELIYGVAGGTGLCFGIFVEVTLSIAEVKLTFWLASFRVPRWREQLQSGDSEERLLAAKRLESMGAYARPALYELLTALRDESADVRSACGRAILYASLKSPPLEDKDIPTAARKTVTDPDFRVRSAAAAILVLFRAASAEEVLPSLMAGLTQGDKETDTAAIVALDLLGPDAAPAAHELKEAVLKHREGMYTAFPVFQKIGVPAVPMLIEILYRGDNTLKMQAIETLGNIGEPAREALPALRTIGRDNSTLKFNVKRAVRKIGGVVG